MNHSTKQLHKTAGEMADMIVDFVSRRGHFTRAELAAHFTTDEINRCLPLACGYAAAQLGYDVGPQDD